MTGTIQELEEATHETLAALRAALRELECSVQTHEAATTEARAVLHELGKEPDAHD